MGKNESLINLGNKFRKARIEAGISQSELANKIGKDQPSINRLEKGNVNPSYMYMEEVCEGLGISLTELLDF